MTTQSEAYIHALYPLGKPEHLSDEDAAYALDKSAKRSAAAHKAQERRRQERAVQGVASEKDGAHAE